MSEKSNTAVRSLRGRALNALAKSRRTVSVTHGRYRALKWFLTALVTLASVPASLEENTLHPALLLALPVAVAGLLRSDYRKPLFLSEGILTGLFVAYIPGFLSHLWALKEVATPPLYLVYFTYGILIVRCLAPLTDRNLVQLIVLSGGLVLIDCLISNHLLFGIILPFYLFSLMGTLLTFHVARSAAASDVPEQTSTAEKDVSTLRRRLVKSTGFIVLLAVAFFILFPRPFAALPGISPGIAGGPRINFVPSSSYSHMASMMGRNRIAFSVKFQGRIPRAPVYWRGTVLEKTDGKEWSPEGHQWPAGYLIKPGTMPETEYKVTPYRLRSNIVYSTGTPLRVLGRGGRSVGVNARGEAIVRSAHLLNDSYQVEAALAPIPTSRGSSPLNTGQAGITDKIRDLAREWTRNTTTPTEKAAAIIGRLRKEYKYELHPPQPPEGAHPTEDFLFTTRTGNCEQFSRAAGLMMRSLGIPTRLVEGFSGMEKTDKKDEFIVRFVRAHVWVEADLGQGVWQTLEPTPRGDLEMYGGMMGKLADLYDAVQVEWIRGVVNFDRSNQRFISRAMKDLVGGRGSLQVPGLGLSAPRDLLLALAILVAAAVTIARLARWRKKERNKASAVYLATMHELVRLRALREVHQWHEENLAETAAVVPGARQHLERFTNAYLSLRFGDGDEQSWDQLHAAREDLLRHVFAASKILKKAA